MGMDRTLQAARASLVEGGSTVFGTFDGPFASVNPLDAAVMGRVPVPRALKAWRLKEWQAFQLSTERYFVCVALFNAKSLGLVQVKLYDRVRREKVLFERKVAPWAFTVADGLLDSQTRYAGRGAMLAFRNRLSEGRIELELDIEAGADWPAIEGNVTIDTRPSTPQVVSIPFGDNHGMYSHKCLMPADGSLRIGTDTVSMKDAFAFMDDHKGYYPVTMRWDWLTAGARTSDGQLVGINLTHNQSIDEPRYNENCAWVDGALHLLPPVRFTRQPSDPHETWHITDDAGHVDVRFDVEMPSRVDIDALVIGSKYSGPYGNLSGFVTTGEGRLEVDGWFGMGEDFYLRC